MQLRMTEKQFQVLAIFPPLIALIWGFYWIPPVLVFFGVKKWAADMSVPAVFGLLYLALRWSPGLTDSYCDLVRRVLKRLGCEVIYADV